MHASDDGRIDEELEALVRAFFGAADTMWMPAEALQAALPRLMDEAAAAAQTRSERRADVDGGPCPRR